MARKLIFLNSNGDYQEHLLAFPDGDGSANQILITDASGNLSWGGHDDLDGFVSNEHIDWTTDQGAINIDISNIDVSQIDHGDLNAASLGDDDHPHYLLADGSRDISGVIEYTADFSGSYTARSLVDKAYVDGIGAGFGGHVAVRVATTNELNATYNNGSSGVGATLTNAGTQAAINIDGVALEAGDRVLVKDQKAEHIGSADLSSGFDWGTTNQQFTIARNEGSATTITLDTQTTDVATTVAEINAELTTAGVNNLFEAFASGNNVGIRSKNGEDDSITIGAGSPSALTTLGWTAGTYENFENGAYEVTTVGSGSTNWVLTRVVDFDNNPENEIRNGDFFPVKEGNTYAGYQFYQVSFNGSSDVVGSNGITFTVFSNPTDYTAGNGIDATQLASNVIQVKLDGTSNGTSGLELGSSGISISDNIAGTYLTLASGVINHDNSGVSANSYGDGANVATFTVDTQGHLTAAGETAISITSSAVTDFVEAAQDAVGTILADSDTIDFTYTDATPEITAVVKTDSINDTHIDWGSTGNQVDASDVPLDTGGTYGGSATNVQDALEELEAELTENYTIYTAGENITKGDLLYIADDGDVNIYDIDMSEYCIGLALETVTSGNDVKVAANDTKITGTATIQNYSNPGDKVYWIYDGGANKLDTDPPNGVGKYVWLVGVALSSTSLHVEVEYIAKRA